MNEGNIENIIKNINQNKLIVKSYNFYKDYIKHMIRTKYPSYENRIAVGLVGEGSECFIYDDDISKDHDYEISLCMWLSDSDYKEIGDTLNNDYKKTVEDYCVKNKIMIKYLYDSLLARRRGAIRISDFYSNILGIHIDEQKKQLTDGEYSYIEDRFFATASNGLVFRDDMHMFSDIRDVIKKYYPKNIYIKKLIYNMHMFSQYGQSNYARSMSRGDYVTAHICVSNCIELCLKILCNIEKIYAPYYKWLRKKILDIGKYKNIIKLLDDLVSLPIQEKAWDNYVYDSRKINENDKVEKIIDNIGLYISNILYEKNYICEHYKDISFLEALIPDVQMHINNC